MEHPFFTATNTRAEALRWLTIAEKLLSTRDLMGSKSFATRARDSDPTLSQADQILAVADTLLAGDSRVGNNQHDWYSILRLTQQQGGDSELVASQYRNLALLLNPQQNRFSFADQAFRLVVDAWSVLSNPSRKSMYDNELAFYMQRQRSQPQQSDPFSNPIPQMQHNFMFFGGSPATSGVAQPQVHVGASSGGGQSHFGQVQQVHVQQPSVEPMGGGSIRESQNFMSFTPGSNIGFGFPPRSNLSLEHVNKPSQDSYPAFGGGSIPSSYGENNQNQVNHNKPPAQDSFPAFGGGNVPPSYGANQEQVNGNNNNKQKQPLENYSSTSHKSSHNVNVSENVGEGVEDEENLEGMDIQEEERVDTPINDGGVLTFWTACPYCYYMYEYPDMYTDCTLKCQNCKSAFQAVVIPSPPLVVGGNEYFCCWGFLPLGFSMVNWEKNKGAAAAWTPFSPMFTCPQMGRSNNVNKRQGGRKNSGPRVYVDDDDDEVFVELSDSGETADDDWQNDSGKRKKKAKNVRGSRGTPTKSRKNAQVEKGKNVNAQDGLASADGVGMANKTIGYPSIKGAAPNKTIVEPVAKGIAAPIKATVESGKKGAVSNARKQPGRVAKNFGRLDLNVECSNEAEEPALRVNGQGRGEDDNIEGIGFFEGLDEFLSSLPILNVVGEDKAVKAA